MDDNAMILSARVRLRCCGFRCDKICEVEMNETIFPEDLADDARAEAEIQHEWQYGIYCPDCRNEPDPVLGINFDS